MKIVTSAGAVVALLIGILTLFERTRNYLKKLWRRLKPAFKCFVAAASLILPNALIVGILTYKVAIYYFEAGSLDLIVTSWTLFVTLVGTQALLVSLYSFLWAILAYPRIRACFRSAAGIPLSHSGEQTKEGL